MAPRDSTSSLLVVACFSRHPEALTWAEEQMQPMYGAIRLRSADYDFHHTRYYEPEMGSGLRKRPVVFETWPWTYADYREPEVMRFLTEARGVLQGLLR